MSGCKTVIVVASVEDMSADVVKRGILMDDFPAYKASREKSNQICKDLQTKGYQAKVTLEISIKNAAVLCGLGVWGKNSLIINLEYGTHLRMCTVLTDWVPEEYGTPIEYTEVCKGCSKCVDACPYGCLNREYCVDGPKCFCKYIDKKVVFSKEMKMCSICQDVCKYNQVFSQSV